MNTDIRSGGRLEEVFVAALRKLLDQVDWLHGWEMTKESRGKTGRVIDLLITLPLPRGGKVLLYVECKKELRPSDFRQFADQIQQYLPLDKKVVPVLGLPSVSPRIAELCAERGWSWFDMAGNCKIDVPGLLRIHRTGQPPVHRRPRPLANLSTPEAGRIIQALLHPEHTGMRWTQRYLAEHFGALKRPIPEPSLGLVNKVVRYLRDEAFIKELPKGGFRVLDPLKLLLAWRDAYRFDRHQRRNYFTLLQGGKLRDALANFGAHADGFAVYAALSAADFQAPHVRQPKTWLYVRESEISKFEESIDAKDVESGENLVVLTPDDDGVFYLGDRGMLNDNRMACTNVVQTYVDLWHCGGRGQEAAEALLEQRLKPAWKEKGLTM